MKVWRYQNYFEKICHNQNISICIQNVSGFLWVLCLHSPIELTIMIYVYIKPTVLKVKTYNITSIMAVSLIWQALLLVIMYVKTFTTDHDIVFIGKVIMCLTSQWPTIFSIRVSLLKLPILFAEIKEKCINYW